MVDGEFAPKNTRQPNQKNCLEGVGRNRMQDILTFGGGMTAPMTLWPSCKTNHLIFRAATCHKQIVPRNSRHPIWPTQDSLDDRWATKKASYFPSYWV